jgi:hypothetical protein
MLPHKEKLRFMQDGYCLLENYFDIEKDIFPIWFGIYRIINLVAERHGIKLNREKFDGPNFDNKYMDLIKVNRAFGGEIYDLVKQLPAFIRVASHPKNDELFCELRSTNFPGIGAGSYGIRIDNPGEEKFRAQWHQEFLFQPQSLDGVVLWTPLVRVTKEIGPVNICVGSHRDGLCKYQETTAYENKTGYYKIGIYREENVVAKYGHVAPECKPGDLIVMDYLTIHQSGINISDRPRWSIQTRLFNFLDPTGMRVGWKGSVATGTKITEIFPENFVK